MRNSQVLVLVTFAGLALVAGCHSSGTKPNEPTNVNPNLRMVAEGANKTLTFKAGHPGELYVYDLDTGEYVFQGHLAPGEQFVIEPDSDHATIDKQPVGLQHDTNSRDTYRLYFSQQ